ncbi:uncharacterized protein LOC132758777 [Ruditapes philippinarum]|uniref:uncharacterized protein LOC132758777 n=1 Tax=Ruditapes philippinarum TaxID=129788 RepID=UPI00295AEC71|nr:uncharacterized protein LOC132758777 [Ruditapes philippinarum]
MKIFQLSSIYDFEIPRCTTYIEEHLPEMLLLPQMVNLTKDSVHLLFSDKRLSYVPMDDRVLFLHKWLDANPNTRRAHMKELLSNIVFSSVSNQCLQACLHNLDAACHTQLKDMTSARSNDHRVLIMKEGNYGDSFWCLDLERDQWFRVELNSLKIDRSGRTVEISDTCTSTTGSIVCSVRRNYPEMSFVLLDLPKDTCTKLNFTVGTEKNEFIIKPSENMKLDGHFCIVSVNKEIKIRMQVERQMIESSLSMSRYICFSTLYIGHIGDSNVEMSPLVSFKDDKILKFAMGENAIAIIFKSRTRVAFYDLNEGHLERKIQTTSNGDDIAQIKSGFVIYDKKRCITFTRLQGACLSHKYHVEEIPFETK